jgi:hypothetical protein
MLLRQPRYAPVISMRPPPPKKKGETNAAGPQAILKEMQADTAISQTEARLIFSGDEQDTLVSVIGFPAHLQGK